MLFFRIHFSKICWAVALGAMLCYFTRMGAVFMCPASEGRGCVPATLREALLVTFFSPSVALSLASAGMMIVAWRRRPRSDENKLLAFLFFFGSLPSFLWVGLVTLQHGHGYDFQIAAVAVLFVLLPWIFSLRLRGLKETARYLGVVLAITFVFLVCLSYYVESITTQMSLYK